MQLLTPPARRSWPPHSSPTIAPLQGDLEVRRSLLASFFRSYGYLSVKCISGVNLQPIAKFASCFPEILSSEIVFLSHERHITNKSIEKISRQTLRIAQVTTERMLRSRLNCSKKNYRVFLFYCF